MFDLINKHYRKSKGIEILTHKNCKIDTSSIRKTFKDESHCFSSLGNQKYLLKDVYKL